MTTTTNATPTGPLPIPTFDLESTAELTLRLDVVHAEHLAAIRDHAEQAWTAIQDMHRAAQVHVLGRVREEKRLVKG